ncbi:MAG: potassium-transporting ATPase subunit KdpA [Neisseriaceae bacterium]|nr:potassium-transporting ATPase subunit KdpA [Neisseriaceae bacterium]
MLQGHLGLNPEAILAPSFDSAVNTAVSFVTNTNWQGYAGETSMSYLTQMLGLAVQNFLSAATGIAVVFALIRGLSSHEGKGVGNFWVDMVRISVWVLLPMAFVAALFFVGQGVIQNFSGYVPSAGLDGMAQILPMGPNASQEAIKLLGTNGGGFFNANSAHPFANPTALSNFVQISLILLIPVALCFCFGRMVGDTRQGWAIFATMTTLFVLLVMVIFYFEQQANPLFGSAIDSTVQPGLQAGGNMEGKETRFGIVASALFTAVTTAASCGAVNNMHDSLMPLSGLVPMVLMQTGEIVFGGVGSGLYGMLLLVILTVFIAGLMIGRSPEYLGKKIEAGEMKAVSLALLTVPCLVLLGTAIASVTAVGQSGVSNPGAHGFSQILYAFTSAANNNGSAFAGLGANTPFYNYALATAMFLGRFGVIVAVLAVAGGLAQKKRTHSAASLPTHGPLFIVLLLGVIVLVGALTYLPALVLGPVIEHVQLMD